MRKRFVSRQRFAEIVEVTPKLSYLQEMAETIRQRLPEYVCLVERMISAMPGEEVRALLAVLVFVDGEI